MKVGETSTTEKLRDTCLIVKYLHLATPVLSGIYTCEQGIIVMCI